MRWIGLLGWMGLVIGCGGEEAAPAPDPRAAAPTEAPAGGSPPAEGSPAVPTEGSPAGAPATPAEGTPAGGAPGTPAGAPAGEAPAKDPTGPGGPPPNAPAATIPSGAPVEVKLTVSAKPAPAKARVVLVGFERMEGGRPARGSTPGDIQDLGEVTEWPLDKTLTLRGGWGYMAMITAGKEPAPTDRASATFVAAAGSPQTLTIGSDAANKAEEKGGPQ